MDVYVLLTIILGFAALSSLLFMKMGFSHVAGYLISGVFLSLIFRESIVEYKDILNFFSEIAIALLAFEIGREIGIRSIRNLTFLPIAILIFEILTAFLIAILVGNLFELKAMEIFILAAMGSFSSSAVVFKLLTDLKFDDEVKRVILTVSVLDDIWAIIVLAILPQLAVGHVHFIEIASLLVFSIVVTAALVFLGLTLLNRVFNKLIKPDELGVSLAISSALLFATISKSFGLSPALGAFAAGIALSMHPRNVDLGNYLKPVREVFLILFFVSLGLEAGLLSEIPVILFFIPILILFGRFLAFTASNWVFSKRSLDECVRIGFLATAAGEFGLIVSYEALNLGLIEREFLTLSAITMILGALSSSKFTPKTDYAEKIASLVPMEIKVFVDSISMSVSRLVESSGGEFMRLLVIRIARNVLVVVVVSLIGSAMLYILDFFTPELRYVNLAIVLAIIFAVILAVSMRTKSYVEDVCSLLVEKRGVNPKIKRVLSGLTFTFIMLTSLNLIILVSGRFFVEVAKEILMIPLGSGFVTFVFFLTFSLSVYFIYTRIRKIP
ncbi:MAG: cation:proton antiporter, partial [Archaeoglobaceae archaeon]